MIHIKNAKICDGTGRPPFFGELLIKGSKIEALGPTSFGDLDARTIDAQGQTLTPGFIDAHRHCDLAVFSDPDFGLLELAQGITTAVMGNCGLSPTPCAEEYRRELSDFLEPCLGRGPAECFFPKVSHYFQALQAKKLRLNLGVLGATGAITTACKGFGEAPFTAETKKRAEGYVRDAMEAGALGLSCGIMYTPECYSTTEDFVFLAGLCGEYGGYLTSHIRGEGNSLCQSVEEVLEIGRRAQVGVNISHFKVTGLQNHGKGIARAIDAIERARAAGQDVTADAYPYTGGSTTILSLIPPTVLERAQGDLPAFLDTAAGREYFAEEIEKEFPGWDNMVPSIGWERIFISSAAEQAGRVFAGLSFSEAAQRAGVSEPELFCGLVCRCRGRVGVIVMSMAQADVERVLALPYASVISDGLYGGGDLPHPRLYGAFPKFLREYAREKRLLPLEEAVYKMTGLPAKRLGLKDRGTLAPGKYADLLLFDPAAFTDKAAWQRPKQLAQGLGRVFVNGKDPREFPGRVLKRQ